MHSALRQAAAGLVSLIVSFSGYEPLRAQLIGLKTVPVPSGEQFLIHPSANMGIGSLWIGLDDPLLDPYVNPARGVRAPRVLFNATPTTYGSSSVLASNRARQAISGTTVPASALLRGDRYFGGFGVALQSVWNGNRDRFFASGVPGVPSGRPGETVFPGGATSVNRYAHAQLGTSATLRTRPVAVGAGVSWADLNALDAVNRLYATASKVEQRGHVADVRLGVVADLQHGRTLDAVLVHHRLDMTHDITYSERLPEYSERLPEGWNHRIEKNLDQTATSGIHLRYTQPLAEPGARLGAIFTANVKDHPKIPTYDIGSVQIPRDPGSSRAFNLGVGYSSTDEKGVFGVDVLVEPAWSHTWADTTTAVVSASGDIIPIGDKTVDNRFRFTNFVVAAGLMRGNEGRSFQVGLQVKAINYTLGQRDYLRDRYTSARESWIEWRPTWGFVARSKSFHVRYTGRMTVRGFPWGQTRTGLQEETEDGGVDFLVPVTEPVELGDYWQLTSQVSITVPFDR